MSREQSAIIKGIAILLMLIYHLDNIIGIQGLDNIFADNLSAASHPINYFLIVSGYGLYIAYLKDRLTWTYLLKRTLKLYLAFWLVLLILVFGVSSVMFPGLYSMPPEMVIMNLMGWRWDYSLFTWFLLPYVFMSLSSKWVFKIIDRLDNVLSLIVSMILYVGMSFLISRYFDSWLQWHYPVYHIILWAQTLFCLTIGAVIARRVSSGQQITWPWLQGKNLLLILLIVASFALRGFIHSSILNPFHAALVVWLVLHIDFNAVFERVFVELGKKSMIMWFAQGFIDNIIFPEGVIVLQWPVLVYVLWTIACYLFACILMPVVDYTAKQLKLAK